MSINNRRREVVMGAYIGIPHDNDLRICCNVHHEDPQDLHIKIQA